MDIGKLSYYSRKIHRISLWGITILGLIQVITGTVLRYPNLFRFVDYSTMRLIHFTTSTYFAIFFLISMITGLIMYFTPWLLKHFMHPQPPTKHSN